jgi:hypothetical protein
MWRRKGVYLMLVPISAKALPQKKRKRVVHLVFCGSFLAVVTLALGCGNKYSVGYADVSGRVLLDGKPLPGGEVSFVTVNGALAARGDVGEDGQYQIKAPIGEVQIGVNNRMLMPPSPRRPGRPKGMVHKTKDGSIVKEDELPKKKGRYVDLPTKYLDPAASGLTYTVTPGSQTHDIQLSRISPTSPTP